MHEYSFLSIESWICRYSWIVILL